MRRRTAFRILSVADQTWDLDPVGNWDETSYNGVTELRQHNEVNELIHRDNEISTGLTYDDNGNLIEDHEHEYVYDAFNRLVEVADKDTGETIATYRYDTENRRVKRIVENSGNLNGTTQYVYDGWQVVEERDGQNAVTATYTYGNYIDEPLTLNVGNDTYYYHTNNLYNVRALTDESGAVVERYRYSAYGEVTILDPNDQEIPESAVENVYMFQGRRLDAETGLYYYRNRFMSSELGRFLQRDPLGYVDGWNLYEFVQGNPINYKDPSGYLTWSKVWGYITKAGKPLWGRRACCAFLVGGINIACGRVTSTDEAWAYCFCATLGDEKHSLKMELWCRTITGHNLAEVIYNRAECDTILESRNQIEEEERGERRSRHEFWIEERRQERIE